MKTWTIRYDCSTKYSDKCSVALVFLRLGVSLLLGKDMDLTLYSKSDKSAAVTACASAGLTIKPE